MSNVTNVGSSAGAAIISSLGVGSGLNVTGIISQLMAVQNQPVNLLQNQEASTQTLVSNFGQLQNALSTFQTAMQGLTSASNYQSVTASVANSSVATVTASSSASAGTYSLQVNQLAQAQTLVTAGQATSTGAIGVGTISFNFGTISGGTATSGKYGTGTIFTNSGSAAKTVTIDSSNNSITGIAAAINAANIGVTASIVNDGSNTPYRLSLTSNNTGAANSMQISVSGDAALSSMLNQDPSGTQNLTETSAAQNAQFNLNGIAITSSTNTASNVISGVSLNLLSTNTTATTLSVNKNNAGATNAVNSFVSAYNTIASTIQQATAYDSSAKQAGPLQGQTSVLSIMSQMQQVLNQPIPGAPSAYSNLAQIGVSFQKDGTLSVDNTKLQAALTANPAAVSGMFASNGISNDSLISYTSSNTLTKPGSYAVNITRLAGQGSITGSAAAATTITAGVNDTLTLNLDGTTANVTLAAGTYTPASLATALQTAINTNNAFTASGASASVSQNAGVLSITSNSYGSKSIANVTGGNGQSDLLGSAAATVVAGVDVAGTINGALATGTGQTLVGATGDNSAGLTIKVIGGSVGARGSINYTQGYTNGLNTLMTSVLGKGGQIAAATAGYNATIKSMQATIANDQLLNQQVLANYQAEFSALDVTMAKLTSTSTYLTQQLAALAK
ncbi:flagellar filament capping protein FliD [Sapientia aquatica]|uniref:Flagellar hook-associated protein 2 n=1 Tax=Sapientia aquatica TaxID=1549640 RepID=A0A4R5W0T5_9BURK|nr:flagellar filament capping protein FliD [Sapientia aquatica]TDK65542.1 flagellar hook protein FliD [Sapientia aquatica]